MLNDNISNTTISDFNTNMLVYHTIDKEQLNQILGKLTTSLNTVKSSISSCCLLCDSIEKELINLNRCINKIQ